MPVAVAELLPVVPVPSRLPITPYPDRLVARGVDDARVFLLDLTACPLHEDEPVATSPQWHLPQAGKAPDPPIVLMKLGLARVAELVVVATVHVYADKPLPAATDD